MKDSDYCNNIPERLFLPEGFDPKRDELGFLEETFSKTLQNFEYLFKNQCVLILAPPWYGKTTTAKQLENYLRENQDLSENSPFDRFFHATYFENRLGASLNPDWWEDWIKSGKHACWIIDAIDEDFRNNECKTFKILEKVEELNLKEKSRLSLIMFSRTDEMPDEIRGYLESIYNTEEKKGLCVLELAPPTRELAKRIAGGNENDFKNICHLIDSNKLNQVASYPIVIKALKGILPERSLSIKEVWVLVLKELLKKGGLNSSQIDIDDAFNATRTMAAILSFSNVKEVSDQFINSNIPRIEDIFSVNQNNYKDLRRAAKAVLKTSVFRRSNIGEGYQFAQSHVQQWCVALKVDKLSLSKFKPLGTDEPGNILDYHKGIFGILCNILPDDNELKKWIIESYGGITPRSGAAPWSLNDAITVLDQIQNKYKETKYGLDKSILESLKYLKIPGIGMEISKRLKDKTYLISERELLVKAAIAVSANESIPVAVDILCDKEEDDLLKLSVRGILRNLEWEEYYDRLNQYACSMETKTWMKKDVKAWLIYEFYLSKKWTFEKAFEYMPESDEKNPVCMIDFLANKLKEDLNIPRAFRILGKINWEDVDTTDFVKSRHIRYVGRLKLAFSAIDIIKKKEEYNNKEKDILCRILLKLRELKLREIDKNDTRYFDLLDHLRYYREIRRKLFRIWIDGGKETGKLKDLYIFRNFDIEDLKWLIQLIEKEKIYTEKLYTEIYWLAYRCKAPRKIINKVRKLIKDYSSDMINTLDKLKKKRKEQERRRLLNEETINDKKEKKGNLTEILEEILSNLNYPLQHRFHVISKLCFLDGSFYGHDIEGTWDDLRDDFKKRCIDLCIRALDECKPTPIPSGSSFPGTIIFEATAFTKIVMDQKEFHLNSKMIEKWLPSILHQYNMYGMQSFSEKVLFRCIEINREISEKKILEQLRREMSEDKEAYFLASSLPKEVWSESFKESATGLLEEQKLALKSRCDLLTTLSYRAPEKVLEIAYKWSDLDSSLDNSREEMIIAGINALIIIDPISALPKVEEQCKKGGGQSFLKKLNSLAESRSSSYIDFNTWTPESLKKLAHILYKEFPIHTDKKPESFRRSFAGPDYNLRRLRDSIPRILFQKDCPDSVDALKELADSYPNVREWYDYNIKHRESTNILKCVTPPDAHSLESSSFVPYNELIKVLLDESEYHLIRNSDDLQLVLIEALECIKKDAQKHLPMLYYFIKKKQRKRMNEDAFQCYISCRLNDLLPGRFLDKDTKTVFIDRETIMARNEPCDIKVEAFAIGGKQTSVIIELKWSDNNDISTSLIDQLGKKYLVNGNRDRGIYLVGWCGPGKWKRSALGKQPRPRDSIEKWELSFGQQSREFNKDHPDKKIKIIPFIMDLRWNKEI